MSIFSQAHEDFRQDVRRFVQEEINPHVDQWEKEIFPAHELFKKMGDAGLLGLSYPKAYGGRGLDFLYNIVMLEEIGRIHCGGVPMAIAVQTDMATPNLAKYGSDELREKYLTKAIAGEYVFSIAVTEPQTGSDVASLETTAVVDGDDYIINGTKMWITNSTQADVIVLLAKTPTEANPRGMSLIAVPTASEGFHVIRRLDKLGQRSSDTGLIKFENVRVPRSHVIGEEGSGFKLQMMQFQVERLALAIVAITAMEDIIEETKQFLLKRQAFGKPLLHNQYIHFKLAELMTEVEACKALIHKCASMHMNGEDMTQLVAMAKLKAGRLGREVSDWCLQFHGGLGYGEDLRISRFYRDARLTSIGGGTDEVMLMIIAKYAGMLPSRK